MISIDDMSDRINDGVTQRRCIGAQDFCERLEFINKCSQEILHLEC